MNCSSLTGVVFPDSIKEIGAGAFDNTGLKKVELPGCKLNRGVFWDCEQLETVIIGEGTEIIPEACFRYCRNLKSIMLPDSVKEIQCGAYDSDGAFADCESLETVSIGAGIETIDRRAFRTTGKGLDVTFREGTRMIPDFAFRERSELVRLVIPESAIMLGGLAVSGCDNLRTIIFRSPACVIPDTADAIPENAVIYGWNNSTAHEYAEKYGRTFVPLRENDTTVLFSCDLNLDGKTDRADAELLFRVIAEAPADGDTPDFDMLCAADLDCSGTLTLMDVSLMLKAVQAADQPVP
ncbi:MAG: leucine-rich repeat protein [Oscillospiraceae bacterium]|nr:leucine-rich repeat protein [Oscillospiraceae bacterium]